MHLPEHAAHIPSPERVARMHSAMTLSDFGKNALPHGHREYCQQPDHICYLCALLYEIAELKAQLSNTQA